MKIALSCQYNDDFKEIAAITVPVMQQYALRHGYSLFVHKSNHASPEIVWQRVADSREMLHYHDAVAHIDADCLITSFDTTLEALMGGVEADLFMSTDCNGINDGFHIWRDTWTGSVVRRSLLDTKGRYSSPQEALADPEFTPDLHMVKWPQHLTNSYLHAEYGMTRADGEWKPGDFILHLPGLSNDRRVEILQQYIR